MKRLSWIAALVTFGTLATARLVVYSYQGDVYHNGSLYDGTSLIEADDELELISDYDGNQIAELTVNPYFSADDYADHRVVLRYEATGTGLIEVPSDTFGGMEQIFEGDVRFGTVWNKLAFDPGHDQTLASKVTAVSPGDYGQLFIQVRAAPLPVGSKASGDFLIEFLDGSSYDLNPGIEEVTINKASSPEIMFDYSVPEFEFFRDEIYWFPGDPTPSPHRDDVSSGIWVVYDGSPYGNPFYIFSPGFTTFQTFEKDEGLAFKSVPTYMGTMTYDISGMTPGLYDVKYWSIPWSGPGFHDQQGNGYGGYVSEELVENGVLVEDTSGVPVSGYVDFGMVPLPQLIEVQFRDAGTTNNVGGPQLVQINEDGSYTANAPGMGNFDMTLKPKGYLRRTVNTDTTGGEIMDVDFSLIGGDIDGDNMVTLLDYDIFSEYYDKTSSDSDWFTVGSNGFAPFHADLDYDSAVTLIDYDIFSSGYDQFGDD